jgi:hypothetical protein
MVSIWFPVEVIFLSARRPVMGKRYRVTLVKEEWESLGQLLSKGKADVRRLKHAQILLLADESKGGRAWSVSRIAEAVGCGTATVERVRRRFVEEGLEMAVSPYRSSRREPRAKTSAASLRNPMICLMLHKPPASPFRLRRPVGLHSL